MSDSDYGLIDHVSALMIEASETLIMPLYQNLSADDIATKSSDTDFVTIADREAEFWLLPRLSMLLDDVFVVGEESISDEPALERQIPKNLSFVVDPIDGTRNFVNGAEHFCSMISLIDHGEPLISWILRPLKNDIIVGVAGEGNFHQKLGNDKQLSEWHKITRDTPRRTLQDMIGTGGIKGLNGQMREAVRAQLRALNGRRLIGSAGCEAALLAFGEHDYLMHAKTTSWDHSPVDIIARQAGLVSYALPSGKPFSPHDPAAILVAPDDASWHSLANHIWPDPVIR